jgi:hypothetical protein
MGGLTKKDTAFPDQLQIRHDEQVSQWMEFLKEKERGSGIAIAGEFIDMAANYAAAVSAPPAQPQQLTVPPIQMAEEWRGGSSSSSGGAAVVSALTRRVVGALIGCLFFPSSSSPPSSCFGFCTLFFGADLCTDPSHFDSLFPQQARRPRCPPRSYLCPPIR